MKKTISTMVASLLLAASAWAGDYVIDESHSAVGFTVKHMMISKVKGQFAKYDATIEFDEKAMKFKPPPSIPTTRNGTTTCAARTSSIARNSRP